MCCQFDHNGKCVAPMNTMVFDTISRQQILVYEDQWHLHNGKGRQYSEATPGKGRQYSAATPGKGRQYPSCPLTHTDVVTLLTLTVNSLHLSGENTSYIP